MPISSEKMKRYPGGSIHSKEWKEFRALILLRAENRCEGTPQHPDCAAENGKSHPETGGKVVLTIAHMDHDETHADPERCRALCQRCHLRWDSKHHARNAAITRRKKSPQIDIEDYLSSGSVAR
jgi:hypothetical protein